MSTVSNIEWKVVPSFQNYEATVDGRVRNRRTLRELVPMVAHRGHLYVFGARGRKLFVHRAVLEAFVRTRHKDEVCRHRDGNSSNNHLENLVWGSPQENSDDKKSHGTMPCGEKSGTAKLTAAQVLEIRSLIGTTSLRALGVRFGVSHTAIRRAATGEKWSCVQ